MGDGAHAGHDHEHLDAGVEEVLRELLDVGRATAEARLEQTTDREDPIEPFALVTDDEKGTRLVDISAVAQHTTTPEGMGRVIHSLLQQTGAEGFAVGARHVASPDGELTHPQAREVVRVIVGHRDGTSGATFCEVRRGPDGPRVSGFWETAAG